MIIDFDAFILLILSLLWLFIILVLKIKYKKENMNLIFLSIFYIYLCFVLKYTQFPIIIDEEMKNVIGQNIWRDANFIPFYHIKNAFKTTFLNTLMTIPFGFGLPFISKINVKKLLFLSLVFCFSLEFLQLMVALLVGFTFRVLDINDIIFNFIGILIGYSMYHIFISFINYVINKFMIEPNLFIQFIVNTKNKKEG